MRWRCPTCETIFHSYGAAETHLLVDCAQKQDDRLASDQPSYQASRTANDADREETPAHRACMRPGHGWMRRSHYFSDRES